MREIIKLVDYFVYKHKDEKPQGCNCACCVTLSSEVIFSY